MYSFPHGGAQRERHSRLARKILPFERVRVWRVPAGDALYRRLEIPETFFLDAGGEFGAEARETRGFVRDHAAPGFLDRGADRVDVERRHGAHVDDLGVDAEFLRRR